MVETTAKKKTKKKTTKRKVIKKTTEKKVAKKKAKNTTGTSEKTETQPEVKIPVLLGDSTVTLGFIARISLLLICLVALVYNFCLILKFSNIPQYESITLPSVITWPLVGEYILASLTLICFAALYKKGFKNLKPLKEEGIIFAPVIGVVIATIFGSVFGIMAGVGSWSMENFFTLFNGGIIVGFFIGMIINFVVLIQDELS